EWCELNDTEALKKEIYSIMSMSFQKMWTDKLAKANTKDYVKLIGRINRETFYSKEIYVHLTPLMKLEEKIDPEIKSYTQKAGDTDYVISLVSYTETMYNHIELSYMINNLNTIEQT